MINMNNEMCTGCGACISSCPFSAMEFKEDNEGFFVPVIDQKKCKMCGICDKVCPIDKEITKHNVNYFAVQNRNCIQRRESQSGGLFSAIAETILVKGGICYGAAIDDNFGVRQLRIDSIDDLNKLQGSKYTQSNPEGSFELVAKDLHSGFKVLFSGTSCMIAGLYNYLNLKKINTEELFTCDLICHGVPSPLLWRDNIELQQNRHGKLKVVNFRDKKNGWHSHLESYLFQNGELVDEGYYTDLFYSHVALRKCCYQCQYVDVERKPADVTMADFWGIKEANLDLIDDNSGISLAVTHTDKGLSLVRESNLLIYDLDAVTAMKNNMQSSAKAPVWREEFWKKYHDKGYEYCLKKYSIYGGIKFKIKRRILKKLGKW